MLDDDEDYTDDPSELGADADDRIEAHAKPAPIERFHRTGIGTALAAGMLGLSDALGGRKEPTPAIVEDWSAREPFEDPIVMRLDPDHPEDSIVMVRPWLKRERDDTSDTDG